MLATILGLGPVHDDGPIALRFRPAVGEKYRYQLRLEDDKGSFIPAGSQASLVYKIAGIKSGVYTIVTSFEKDGHAVSPSKAPPQTFSVDQFLHCMKEAQTFGVSPGPDLLATDLAGKFGVRFPSTLPKVGQSWTTDESKGPWLKRVLDFANVDKSKVAESPASVQMTVGDLTSTTVEIRTKMTAFLKLSDKKDSLTFDFSGTQTALFDLKTGMPISLCRVAKMKVKFPGDEFEDSSMLQLSRVSAQ